MNTMRRILAMLVLAAMLVGAAGAEGNPAGEAATAAPRIEAEETAKPTESKPEGSKPAESKPETAAPEDSKTAAPEVKPEAAETAAPEADAPEAEGETPSASATTAPDETGEVEASPAPEQTPAAPEAPEATEAPETSEAPEVPEEPEVSETPEASATPEASEEPDLLLAREAEDAGALEGTTAPVDDSTTLADGEYAPEGFSFSGGTGKTTITCEKVIVSGGRARAVIAFSSKNYVYVKANGQKFDAEVVDGKSTVTIPVQLNADNRIIGMTRAMSKEQEIEYTIHVALDETAKQPEEGQDGTTSPVDDSTTLADGEYPIDAANFSFSGGTGKTTITCEKVIVSGGKAKAKIAFSSAKYTLVKASGQQFEATVEGDQSTFTIPVDLNANNRILATTTAMTEAHEIEYTIRITLDETAKQPEPQETDDPNAPEDGDYEFGVESDFSMFKITKSSAKVVGGKVIVTISTAKGTYDKIYLGSKDDEDKSSFVQGVANADGGYDFTFEVAKSLMGKTIDFVPGKPDGSWYVKNQYHLTIPEALGDKVGGDSEGEADGDYEFGVESDFSMFKITKSSAKVVGGKVIVTISTAKGTYDKIYLGSKDDEPKEPIIQGIANAEGGYDFTFEVAKSLMGQTIDFVPGKPDGSWYVKNQYHLTIPEALGDKIEEGEPQPPEINHDQLINIYKWYMKELEDGSLRFTLLSKSVDFDKIYVGRASDATREPVCPRHDAGNGEYYYRFTIQPEQMVNDGIYVPLLGGFTDGTWASEEIMLSVSLASDESEMPQLPGVYADGEYGADVEVSAPLLRFKSATVKVEGDRLTLVVVNEAVDYDRIYLGGNDETKEPVYIGKLNAQHTGYVFELPLPVSALGTEVKFMLGKVGGSWNGPYTIKLPATLGEAVQPETEPDVNSYSDGSYEADAGIFRQKELNGETVYYLGAFEALVTLVEVKGDEIIVTIKNRSSSYDAIFVGPEAEKDASKVVLRTYHEEEQNAGTYYHYTFTLPRSALGTAVELVPYNTTKQTWGAAHYLLLPKKLTKVEGSDEPTPPPVDPDTPDVDDGEYSVEVESSASMFRVVKAVLTTKGGKYTAVITLSGTGYDYLYLGTAEAAAKASEGDYIPFVPDAEGKYTYTITVPSLDKPFDVAAHSIKNDQWYDRQLTFKSDTLVKTGDVGQEAVDDGMYSVEVESSASMFKVVKAALTAKDGKYTAVITLSGTGYDKLFLGTAEAAGKAGEADYIGFVPDTEGKYTYAITVPYLDKPFDVAAHSIKNDQWYDRQLTFKSDTLVKTGDVEPDTKPTDPPTVEPTDEPSKKPEADLSGSTSRVDSSTGLADGTYKPDRFSYSGGTGRVKLSCSKVTVKGGKATATIVFSSPNYSYVKASGQKIYGSHGGGSSTFEVPVKLNANNKIIGMTTAMTQDHEVEYTIYVYLAAAEAANASDGGADGTSSGAADAPQVPGLTYESTDALDAAKKFGIYRYEGGSAVIRVEGAGEYLIADAGAELPAGIEEEITVIRRPVTAAYVAAPEVYEAIRSIGDAALAAVKLAGFEGGEPGFAGSCDAPEYAALLAGSCDLAIMPGSFADARVQGTQGEPDAWLCEELSDADAAVLADVAERLDMLGIPLFVDRSADEESEAARLEWIKVYGVIFGCEDAAKTAYAAATASAA